LQKLKKNLCLILLPQAVCLAFGLWIHFRFVVASAKWASRDVTVVDASSPTYDTRALPESVSATSPVAPVSAEHIISSLPAAGAITFVWIAALQCIAAYLVLARSETKDSREQQQFDRNLQQQSNDLVRTRNAIIFGLAKLADSRDPETGNHLDRISLFATRLATALRKHPRYREQISAAFVQSIGIAAVLHDIGKVALPDSILLKPDVLSDDERERMKHHTTIAADCLAEIDRRLGNASFLGMAREIANFHHERWDGTGYPHGLNREQIPLAARIVALADVYDALSVRRVYKKAFPHEECVQYIRKEAGQHFDPVVVEVFLSIESQFEEISTRFAHSNASRQQKTSLSTLVENQLTSEQEETLTAVLHPVDEDTVDEKTLDGKLVAKTI